MNNSTEKRFKILKIIYERTGLGISGKAMSRIDIYKETMGIHQKSEKEFLDIIEYLQQKSLIDFAYDDGRQPYFRITYQGRDEVEAAINKPDQPTDHFPSQVFNTTINAPVGAFQQAGEGNISNVTQNIGNEGVFLDDDALKKLQGLIDSLTSNKPEDLSQSQAYQGAAILSELKESGERKDSNGQAQAITKWREWWNKISPKAQAAFSLTADTLSLGLPLVKLLITGSPF